MFVSYLDALSCLISSGRTNIFQFVKVKAAAAAALKESTLHLLTFYSLKFLLMLHWTAPAPGHVQALMHAPNLIFPYFHPNPQDSHCLSRAASTVCFCCSGALQQCGQQSVSTELSLKQFPKKKDLLQSNSLEQSPSWMWNVRSFLTSYKKTDLLLHDQKTLYCISTLETSN